MSSAALLNYAAQTRAPALAANRMPDTCTITTETTSPGTGGGRVKSGTTDAYTSIPCAYEPKQGSRFNSADQLVSIALYTVTLPTHTSAGTRINLNTTSHRIVVAARGNEPAKTFRIVAIKDDLGAVFEVDCEREN